MQRAAQDKQLELLIKELTAVDSEVTQSKIAKSEEKGTSKGTPVFAAFKDGFNLEDGAGNWNLAINGRLQTDYRHFSPDESAADTFIVRRARLAGTLTFYKD